MVKRFLKALLFLCVAAAGIEAAAARTEFDRVAGLDRWFEKQAEGRGRSE